MDCRLSISDFPIKSTANLFADRQLKIEKCVETPKRGQGAQCPDRLFAKKRLFLHQIFWE
jgi:hypothetical protein